MAKKHYRNIPAIVSTFFFILFSFSYSAMGADYHIVGSCDTPGEAQDVYISGSYAYVTDGRGNLQVIDISDPSNPDIIGSCDTPGCAEGVYVSGSYAYVADGDSGLQVIRLR